MMDSPLQKQKMMNKHMMKKVLRFALTGILKINKTVMDKMKMIFILQNLEVLLRDF
jgi:hypothetical protein